VKVIIGRRFYPLGLPETMIEEITNKVMVDLRKHGTWPEFDGEPAPWPNWHGPSGGPWSR